MASLNRCEFIGNLGADPEIRYTQDGKSVANLRIAVNESWKDASGAKQERTTWVRVVAFGKLAEIMGEYLTKGSQAYVAGRLQERKWQDKDGNDRYTTEVIAGELVMLGSKGERSERQPRQAETEGAPQGGAAGGGDEFDDSIPF